MSQTLSRADMILERDRDLSRERASGKILSTPKRSKSQNARVLGAMRDAVRTENIIKQLCTLTNDYHKKLGGNGKRVSLNKATEPLGDVIDFIKSMS